MHNRPVSIQESDSAGSTDDQVYPDPANQELGIDRRQFLALTGASAALAGVLGCSLRPAPLDEIVPYVKPPEGLEPGTSLSFATAMELGGAGLGLLVASREGRPIKVEGNPDHPGSLGATDLFSQASLLGLYDPDRSGAVIHRGTPSTWDTVLAELRSGLRRMDSTKGAGLRILTGAVTSPTLEALLAALLRKYPEARWVRHEPAGSTAAADGARRTFGQPLHAVHDLQKASVVLALDADFLGSQPGSVRDQHDFASRRRVRAGSQGVDAGDMNRLYAVETMLTTTGANADHRLAVRAHEIESMARALAAALDVQVTPPPGPIPQPAQAWIAPLARDLLAHKGRSLVLVGQGQPASVHALGHALNAALENLGKTVHFIDAVEARPDSDSDAGAFRALVDEMTGGKVELLLVLETNPVYTALTAIPGPGVFLGKIAGGSSSTS